MLAMPKRVLEVIPPRLRGLGQVRSFFPGAAPPSRDLFPGRTGHPFDPLGAAETAANMTVERLLHSERAARLVEHHAREPDTPGLGEVIDGLVSYTWKETYEDGYHAELGRMVDSLVLYNLMALASDEGAADQVRAIAYLKLDELKDWLCEQVSSTECESQRAHYMYGASQIRLFQESPDKVKLTKPLETPQGPPI